MNLIEILEVFAPCNILFSEYALFYILTMLFIFVSSGKAKHDIILGATLAVTSVCIGIINYNNSSNETIDFVLLIILASYTFFVLYSMFFKGRIKFYKGDREANVKFS